MEHITHSVERAMKRLGCSRKTFYNLINAGLLRTYKVGARRYVSEQAILDFIREREAATNIRGAA